MGDYIQAERESLFDNGLCPNCGAALEFSEDRSLDTKVPLGNQMVVYEKGGRFECPSLRMEGKAMIVYDGYKALAANIFNQAIYDYKLYRKMGGKTRNYAR